MTSKDKEKQDEKKKERKADRKILTPTATQAADMEPDVAMLVRGAALFFATSVLRNDPMVTATQTVAMATKFEGYLIHGDLEERDG